MSESSLAPSLVSSTSARASTDDPRRDDSPVTSEQPLARPMEPLATDRPRHSTRREFVVPASVYTPYYCEENAYNVVKALESTRPGHVRETWACFVSNVDRHAILFEQNASRVGPEQASYVVWDYHVFVVAALNDKDESVIVIDRDSRLGPTVDLRGEPFTLLLPAFFCGLLTACSRPDYIEKTFRPSLFRQGIIDPSFAR